MRWPFVSREAYEAVCNERDHLRAVVVAERGRLDGLVAAERELKREGFAPPAKPDHLVEETVDLADDVHHAIGLRAAPNTELERELRKWAALMARQGMTPEVIAKKIMRGGSADEEDGA